MTLSLQDVQTRFKANFNYKLADGRLITELSQADPTTVLRILNQYTQNVRVSIQEKAQEIAKANGISAESLLSRAKENFASSFEFISDCQKATNILESTASLPEEANLHGFLTRYSQLRKDYDAIVDLMIIDAL